MRNDWPYYVMMLPGLLYFLIYKYMPIYGVVIAFKDYSVFAGIWESEWVGLEHFRNMFMNPSFYQVFRNTLLISLYKLFWGFPGPIILAIMINEVRTKWFQRGVQTLVYLPHFFSWVILGGILTNILSPSTGIVNGIIKLLGFEPIFFLGNADWFRTILVVSDMWQDVGWGTIIYLAALAGIDPSLYEAAIVDGANKWQQTRHITIPSIMFVIVVLFTLRLGHVLDVGFDQIFIMLNPLVYDVGDVIETFVYREGIIKGNFSYTTAVGLFKSVIGLMLVVLTNRIAKRFGHEGIW